MDAAERIREVYKELKYPSVSYLVKELRGRGVRVTADDVRAALGDAVAPREATHGFSWSKCRGKITASSPNARWFVDTLAYTTRPDGTLTHVFVAQDVFTRKIYTKAAAGATAKNAKDAFVEFVEKAGTLPKEVTCDAGAEYMGVFAEFLREKNAPLIVKNPQDVNAIGTIDNAINQLKKSIETIRRAEDKTWSQALPEATEAYNERRNQGENYDYKPNEIEGNDDAIFDIEYRNAQNMRITDTAIRKRAELVEKSGGFREFAPKRDFRRTDDARVKGDVHAVERVEGDRVVDKEGRVYQTKLVAPTATRQAVETAPQREAAVDAQVAERRKELVPVIDAELAKWEGQAQLSDVREVLATHNIKLNVERTKKLLERLGYTVMKPPGRRGYLVSKAKPPISIKRPRWRRGALAETPEDDMPLSDIRARTAA